LARSLNFGAHFFHLDFILAQHGVSKITAVKIAAANLYLIMNVPTMERFHGICQLFPRQSPDKKDLQTEIDVIA
jgi:hypothetical protein